MKPVESKNIEKLPVSGILEVIDHPYLTESYRMKLLIAQGKNIKNLLPELAFLNQMLGDLTVKKQVIRSRIGRNRPVNHKMKKRFNAPGIIKTSGITSGNSTSSLERCPFCGDAGTLSGSNDFFSILKRLHSLNKVIETIFLGNHLVRIPNV